MILLSTKIACRINPLLLIEREGNLKVAFEYNQQKDIVFAIQGFSDLKIGRSSTKDVLSYSGILKDSRVEEYRSDGYCVALTIKKEKADNCSTTPLRICTELLMKFANTFVRRTHGTRFYVKKYR